MFITEIIVGGGVVLDCITLRGFSAVIPISIHVGGIKLNSYFSVAGLLANLCNCIALCRFTL